MIGFSTVLGVGLFLSAGKAIFLAGPGGAVLAYLVTGTIVWYVMLCLVLSPLTAQVRHGMHGRDDCPLPRQGSRL
jgi:amino acid permease